MAPLNLVSSHPCDAHLRADRPLLVDDLLLEDLDREHQSADVRHQLAAQALEDRQALQEVGVEVVRDLARQPGARWVHACRGSGQRSLFSDSLRKVCIAVPEGGRARPPRGVRNPLDPPACGALRRQPRREVVQDLGFVVRRP